MNRIFTILAIVACMFACDSASANSYDILGDEPSYDILGEDTTWTIGQPKVVTLAMAQEDCPDGICPEPPVPEVASPVVYTVPGALPVSNYSTSPWSSSVVYSEPLVYSVTTYSEPVVYYAQPVTFAARIRMFANRQGFRARRRARKQAKWCR